MSRFATVLRSVPLALGGLACLAPAALAEAEKKVGMPQLDPTAFAPQIVWLIIVFVALYALMAKVALPRIADVLEKREQRIAGDLDEAERLKRESEQAIAKYEAALADARAKALAIGAGARAEQAGAAASRRAAAAAQFAGRAKEAEAGIAAAKQAALANLQGIAAAAARDAVKKLLGDDVDADTATAAIAAVVREGR